MKRLLPLLFAALLSPGLAPAQDARVAVEMPPMMRDHMLANMRDHLAVVDRLVGHLAAGEFDAAAELAEARLGMSAMPAHGADRMAGMMPAGMQELGGGMHRAASRFARVAAEGDTAAALVALREVTATCVACHAAYRVK